MGILSPLGWVVEIKESIDFINKFTTVELMFFQRTLSLCALAGNNLAKDCLETLDRLIYNINVIEKKDIKPIGEKYLIKLAKVLKFVD